MSKSRGWLEVPVQPDSCHQIQCERECDDFFHGVPFVMLSLDGGNTPPITRKDLPRVEEAAVYQPHNMQGSPRGGQAMVETRLEKAQGRLVQERQASEERHFTSNRSHVTRNATGTSAGMAKPTRRVRARP